MNNRFPEEYRKLAALKALVVEREQALDARAEDLVQQLDRFPSDGSPQTLQRASSLLDAVLEVRRISLNARAESARVAQLALIAAECFLTSERPVSASPEQAPTAPAKPRKPDALPIKPEAKAAQASPRVATSEPVIELDAEGVLESLPPISQPALTPAQPSPIPAQPSTIPAQPSTTPARPAPEIKAAQTLEEPFAASSTPPRSAAPGEDKRRHQRVNVDIDINLMSEHNFFMGFAENISEGGLFISTHQILPIGAELDVTFRLPLAPEIQARCRVQWIRPFNAGNLHAGPGMGVQFLDLKAQDRKAILNFIRRRAPIFYE